MVFLLFLPFISQIKHSRRIILSPQGGFRHHVNDFDAADGPNNSCQSALGRMNEQMSLITP